MLHPTSLRSRGLGVQAETVRAAVVLLAVEGSGSGCWFIAHPFLAVPAVAVGALWLPRSRTPATEKVSRD